MVCKGWQRVCSARSGERLWFGGGSVGRYLVVSRGKSTMAESISRLVKWVRWFRDVGVTRGMKFKGGCDESRWLEGEVEEE